MRSKSRGKPTRSGGGALAHVSPGGKTHLSRRPSRRKPTQERSRATVDDILEAAADVFGRLGYAGTTTNKIAERAGFSIGSLYQYFADKDEILRVLLERHQREARRVIDAAVSKLSDPDVPLDRVLNGLLHGLLELHQSDPALSRVLAQGIHDDIAKGRGGDADDEGYVSTMQRILDRRTDVNVADTAMAATVVVRGIELLVRWVGHDAPKSFDADAFVDELVTMFVKYLTGES
jgi:AcrR family transcriptional regulator